MNKKFHFWASVLVMSLVVMGLSMKVLALQGAPLSDGLVLRGATCFFIVLLYARTQRLSLWPKSLKTQCFRALLAGLALTLFALSYNWLTASDISVLSNIDVPLLMVLGPLVGIKTSSRIRLCALISIAFLVWYICHLSPETQIIYGLTTLMISCILLCFGYFLIKKSMNEENQAITILVPSLALIFYGLIQAMMTHTNGDFTWTSSLILIDVLSGLGMFGAYIASMELYKVTNLASAEFPTLIASLVIQPFEAVLLDIPLEVDYVVPSVAFVIVTYFILNLQNKELYSD